MKSLTEEQKRMRELMGFTYEDNSHDVLSEQNIKSSTSYEWTEESAEQFNENVLYKLQLLKEEDLNEEENDLGFESEEDEEGFLNYAEQYFEKLLGAELDELMESDNNDSIVMVEQGRGADWLYKLIKKGKGKRKARRRKRRRKIEDFFDSIFGGGGKPKTKKLKNLKRKLKNSGKDLRQWFRGTMRDLRNKWREMKFATKKKFLRLGRKLRSGLKLTIGKYKPSERNEMLSSDTFTVDTPFEEWDELLNSKYAKKMVSLMKSGSQRAWEELKQDKENKGFAVAAVEYFMETYKEKKWKKVTVGVDHDEIIEKIPIENETEPEDRKFEPIEIPFPTYTKGSKLFEDNEYTLDNAKGLKEEVELFIDKLKDEMSKLNPPEGKPRAALTSLQVDASCSRFRNDVPGSPNMSFYELAQKRIETTTKYIKQELKKIGVIVHEDYVESFNASGSNGDGSSGPNPPKGFSYVPVGKGVPMDENCPSNVDVCKVGGKEVNRNEAGTPHADKKEYDKYKYVGGFLDIILNTNKIRGGGVLPPDEDEKFEVISTETVEYPITFYTPPKDPFTFRLPKINLRFKSKGRPTHLPPRRTRRQRSISCPAFD